MNKVLVSSKKMDWETPQKFFNSLNKKFKFDLDACASDDNHKLDNYITSEQTALNTSWCSGNVFCNPPYGRELGKFVKKAYEEHIKNKDRLIVLLIPARTDTSYYHDYIYGKATVKYLRGRLKFEVDGVSTDAAPFPSALIIYGI